MPKRWIYPAGLVVVLLIAFYIYRKYHVAPEINLDALSLTDTGGNPVTLRSMKGKKMVVCFGASWCGSCRKELKDIAAVKGTALNDAEVIVISDEPLEKVQMLKDKTNYPFLFLKMDKPFNAIGINSIPTSYIVNTRFEIMKETVGYIDWKDASTLQHLKKLME